MSIFISTTQYTVVITKFQEREIDMSKVSVNKTSGRNFYAVKTVNGKEQAFAFETVANRKRWLDRQVDSDAREISAPDVYRMLQKGRDDYLCANRFNRVYVIDSADKVNTEKGQRLVM